MEIFIECLMGDEEFSRGTLFTVDKLLMWSGIVLEVEGRWNALKSILYSLLRIT
jgi:hypothetical protein